MLPRTLDIGSLARPQLRSALADAGVRLNDAAETLLRDPAFADHTRERVTVVHRTVRELGLGSRAPMPSILSAAAEQGLAPCPMITGPYLRLHYTDQESAPDSILSTGAAPSA